jgi:hypothetical protein
MKVLTGRVVVVAGDATTVAPSATALQEAGAAVALVAMATTARSDVTVHVRADPYDIDVWDRVSMHVEQHLGPVDAVVTDATSYDVVRAVFATDLRRRGHGDIVIVEPGDDVAVIVTKVAGTQ